MFFGVAASAQKTAPEAQYQAYDGPVRVPEEVALLTVSPTLLLSGLDGRRVYWQNRDGSVREGCTLFRPPKQYRCRNQIGSFQLLPGEHTAALVLLTSGISGPGCFKAMGCVFNSTFTVSPGKKYLASLHEENLGEAREPLGDNVYRSTKYPRLSVEIAEVKEQPAGHKHGKQNP